MRPLGRRKKLDRGKGLVSLVVPGPLPRVIGPPRLGLDLAFPDCWSIRPAHPHDLERPAGIADRRLDVRGPADGARPTNDLAAPQRHRELGPRRVAGAGLGVAEPCGVTPPR